MEEIIAVEQSQVSARNIMDELAVTGNYKLVERSDGITYSKIEDGKCISLFIRKNPTRKSLRRYEVIKKTDILEVGKDSISKQVN